MSQHHRIDYFDLSANDLAAVKRFYSGAFDWIFTDYGPGYAGFRYLGAKREAGGISVDTGTRAPLGILYSDDLEAASRRCARLRERLRSRSFSFPGGRRFHFIDPGGNELAVWSDK